MATVRRREKRLYDFDWFDMAALAAMAALALVAMAGWFGCSPIPAVFTPSGASPIFEVLSAPEGATPGGAVSMATTFFADGADGAEASSPPAPAGAGDGVDFSLLEWAYGGFNGAGAQAVDGCRIASLNVGSHGMSYKWAAGGCEMLGAASKTSADCIAALFVRDAAGNWRGGKFDWISTSRTTRDFANIETGYGGWPTTAILNASAYAFVIVSKDGRKRSNLVVQEVHR